MRRHLPLLAVIVTLAAALPATACGTSAGKETSQVNVFLDNEVTADQRAAIDQQLRGMPTVRNVTFTSKQQAYEDFKKQFKDSPGLVAATRPDSLPESFTATVDSGFAEVIQAVLASGSGVDWVGLTLPSGTRPRSRVGLILELRPGITADDRTAVEAAIRRLPDAKPARFESADAARTRLKARCRGERALAAALDRASPFASYRFTFTVTARSWGSSEYVALSRLPGVADMTPVPAALL